MSAFLFRRKDKPKPLNEELFRRVSKILSGQLSVDEIKITPDARIMDDLGADSLNIVELVLALEEEFTVEISDEDAEKIQTVREIVEYIAEQLQKRGSL